MFCRECGKPLRENAEVCVSCGVYPLNARNYCQECGAPTKDNQEICTNCGCRLIYKTHKGFRLNGGGEVISSVSPKSPTTATILTCFITGLGQIYLGQTLKGITLLAAIILLGALSGGVLVPVMWIAAMVDAYRIGTKLANGESVGQWEFF